MSWAHRVNPEWNQFTAQNADSGGQLVLGRITYDLMAGFWPTPYAVEQMPQVAELMNRIPKLVFSRKLREAACKRSWSRCLSRRRARQEPRREN